MATWYCNPATNSEAFPRGRPQIIRRKSHELPIAEEEDLPTIPEASIETGGTDFVYGNSLNGGAKQRNGWGQGQNAGMSKPSDDQYSWQGWRKDMTSDYDSSIVSIESTESGDQDDLYDDTLLNAGLDDTGGANGHEPFGRRPSNVKDMVDNFEESDQFRRMSLGQGQPSSGIYGTVSFSSVGYAQRSDVDSYDGSVSPAPGMTDGPQFMNQLHDALQRRQSMPQDGVPSVYTLESDVKRNGDHSPLSPYHTYYSKEQLVKPTGESPAYVLYDDANRVRDAPPAEITDLVRPSKIDYGDDEPIYQDPSSMTAEKDSYDPVIEYHDSDSDQDYTWGSTEFDSFSDEEEKEATLKVDKKERRRSSAGSAGSGMLVRIRQTIRQIRDEPESDDDEMYIEFNVNEKKHPPPTLPPCPDNLTPEETKRRHIVGCIIDSENSYVASLHRLVKEYQVPLLESSPPIISRVKVRTIFYKVKQILQCHTMFQIALSGRVVNWDKEQKIGDCFTASFSKSMVLDVYSDFVNNFSVAMDLAKYCAKQKPAFAEFMRQKQTSSADKLSIFGLMVKPVQRFPQFILLLQDLLKHTSKDHHDRLALQLALTELENLAHKLNDRKRDSEQCHAAKLVFSNLNVKLVQKTSDAEPHLIREDDVVESRLTAATTGAQIKRLQSKGYQVYNHNGNMIKSKPRHLVMLNDTLLCAGVQFRETDMGRFEKYHLKLSVPIKNVLVKDTVITPDTKVGVRGQLGRITICSVRPNRPDKGSDELYHELDNLLHDFTIISQMSSLVSSLKCSYEKLNEELLQDMSREIQVEIQRLDDHLKTMDSSALQLVFRSKSGHKERLHIQMGTPEAKQSWLADLRTAQLAASDANNPGWMEKEGKTKRVSTQLPLFMDPLHVNITQQNDRVTCCVAFLLPSYREDGRARQFLWLCGGTDFSSSVTVISLGSEEVHVTESFTACDGQILCTELVPGCPETEDAAFAKETVWMGTSTGRIFVHRLQDGHRQDSLLSFSARSSVLSLCYANDKVFAGLQSGEVAVYQRNQDGSWRSVEPTFLPLASHPVTSILAVESNVWCACGKSIHILDSNSLKVENVFKLSIGKPKDDVHIKFMVRAGVGLFISFSKIAVIQLYHMETLDHLQDINVASSVARSKSGPTNESEPVCVFPPEENQLADVKVEITAMTGSRSWLWIGTSAGRILCIPLPRLEGVPLTTGRPLVSYHGHDGPVSFLVPTVKPLIPSKLLMSKVRKLVVEEDVKNDAVAEALERSASKVSVKGKIKNFKLPDFRASKRKSGGFNMQRNSPSFVKSPPRRRSSAREEEPGLVKAKSLGNLSKLDDSGDYIDDINELYSSLMCERDSFEEEDVYDSLLASGSDHSFVESQEEPLYMTFDPESEEAVNYRKKLAATNRRQSTGSVTGERRSSYTLPANLKSGSIRENNRRRPKSEAYSFSSEEGRFEEAAYASLPSTGIKSLDDDDMKIMEEPQAKGKETETKRERTTSHDVKKSKMNFVGNSYIVMSGGKNYKSYKLTGSNNSKIVKTNEPLLLMWQCAL
ncbi:rho guanine nucleotide exchange factor 10-like protein isoform X2 [Lineus longissimus]|uniref:rho guanine nucleotide exchange factor 10-like protein isoform X2 n=1 Tax=Lineus longissimus TaxID=88925 RepID=UPI00315DE162